MAKKFLIIVTLLLTLMFMHGVYAITANSTSYSVNLFGTGMAASEPSSEHYETTTLSETEGATRGASNDQFTTNIGFFENTSYYIFVNLISYTVYPDSAVRGSIIRFSVSALNSESVWAVLTPPSGAQETISLTNNGDAYYTANTTGTYTVTFYANSSQGNIASAVDTFTITSPASSSPATTSPSGGGTTTLIQKCTYVWDCTSWSICSEGIQERTCKNTGNCTGTEGKPPMLRKCLDSLFDVLIEFKETPLVKNKTLKFGIELEETKGIEKIDVQIKYSIIKDNTEVFSQIETRAIEGNLTYEKALTNLELEDGEYILRVDILYGNQQRAFAEQKFGVKGKLLGPGLSMNILVMIIAILILAVFFMLVYTISKYRKRNPIEKHLGEGFESLARGNIVRARAIYEEIKKKYNPDEDTHQKTYKKIIEFYNQILESRSKQ